MDCSPEYLSGAMSLRKPQSASVKLLAELLEQVPLHKGGDLAETLRKVHALCHTCTDFERGFPSFTFALATGVGKTRLMGAFIAHLFACHGVRNFFVVAPNTTIYEKLKRDLGEPGTPKYVFSGIAAFANNAPIIITGETYQSGKGVQSNDLFRNSVVINIFNIAKLTAKDKGHFAADDAKANAS